MKKLVLIAGFFLPAALHTMHRPTDAQVAQLLADEELALHMQKQEQRHSRKPAEAENKIDRAAVQTQLDRDSALARQLQQEEDKKRNSAQEQQRDQDAKSRTATETAIAPITSVEIRKLDVCKQSGLDCGFHSIKNCFHALQWLSAKSGLTEKEFHKRLMSSPNSEHFHLETMRSLCPHKTNIMGEDILFLAQQFYGMQREQLTLIENIFQANAQLTGKDIFSLNITAVNNYLAQNLTDTINALRTKARAVCAFIIGDLTYDNKGHWFAVIAHKENNKLILYYMNSLYNDSHDALAMTKALSSIIQRTNIKELDLIGKIRELNAARRAMNQGNYEGALCILQELIELAQKAKVLGHVSFSKYAQEIKTMIREIANVARAETRQLATQVLATLQ